MAKVDRPAVVGHDPVELDGRADVYALAGTIYNVTTGRSFFDDVESPRDRMIAHMRRDPFEDAERLRPFPAAIARVLRSATAREAVDRPNPLEFARDYGHLDWLASPAALDDVAPVIEAELEALR